MAKGKIKDIIVTAFELFFGETRPEQRKRIWVFLRWLTASLVLMFCLDFGYNKKDGLFFHWTPIIDSLKVNITKEIK